MSSSETTESRNRPFPWLCVDCFTRTVEPTVMDYAIKVKHDGLVYDIHLPRLEVPRCKTCGNTYPTDAVDEQASTALRARLRLLLPAQIRKGLEQLGLEQDQLAERLGVASETVARWLSGDLIQSRAMDNLLRVYFAFPQVREALRGQNQDPHLGALPLEASVP